MSGARLLVDIGNSRIKWVLATDSVWTPGLPFPTHDGSLAAALDRHWSSLQKPKAVAVSNVAGPEIARILDHWVGNHWGIPVHYAQSEARLGHVINGYSKPEQLGVDRWLGLVGLQASYSLPACLVDCGTAITLDFLDASARHHGGLIAPGLETMRSSLLTDTQGLNVPMIGPSIYDSPCLGQDTESCVRSGCIMACAGLVDKSLQGLMAAKDGPIQLVLTGGDAKSIGTHLSFPFVLDEAIVLRGLLVLSQSRQAK